MKYGGNKYISLSGNWDDGSLHAIVNETYRCTMHDALSQKVWYSFTFCTQQSTVGLPYAICMMIYMLKQTYILYNELGDMSSCTSAMWQYEPRYAQITNENWVIFFNFTQQSTLLQRYLWDERSLMDAWDQVVLIMRNHIIQTVNGAIDHSEVV